MLEKDSNPTTYLALDTAFVIDLLISTVRLVDHFELADPGSNLLPGQLLLGNKLF